MLSGQQALSAKDASADPGHVSPMFHHPTVCAFPPRNFQSQPPSIRTSAVASVAAQAPNLMLWNHKDIKYSDDLYPEKMDSVRRSSSPVNLLQPLQVGSSYTSVFCDLFAPRRRDVNLQAWIE
jgi:hypothetical protein